MACSDKQHNTIVVNQSRKKSIYTCTISRRCCQSISSNIFFVNFAQIGVRHFPQNMKSNNGKLWATLKNGEFELRTITESDLEEALDLLDKSFFINESVCIACEINLPENAQARRELRELCKITAQDGVSLMVKHVPSNKIVSVSFNKIQYIPTAGESPFFIKFRDEQVTSPQARRLMNFMIEVDELIDVCAMFSMSCFCELMFLATDPAFERLGLGRQLAHYTIELTRELSQGLGVEQLAKELRDMRPAAVTALWTSRFSQKLGKAAGFKVLNVVPYTEYSYNGKRFNERIGTKHTFCEHVAYVF